MKVFDKKLHPLLYLKKLPIDFLVKAKKMRRYKSEEKLAINDLIEFSRKDQERIK